MSTPVILTKLDPRYPSRLLGIERSPPSISWHGGPVEADRTVAIVGARHATRSALAFASEIASVLATANTVVVSGGAIGIDAAAHEAVLRMGGRTWAVAGTGPGYCYPASHADLFDSIAKGPGAMLWPFEAGYRGAFLARNHVLVALADAVVVVQAGLRSGALHTASCAIKLGKPLWVVPAAPWTSEFAGSLKLVEAGARILTSVGPLLSSLGVASSNESHAAATGEARSASLPTHSSCEYEVLESISNGPLHVDAIVARVDQSVQAVSAALLTLALENVVVEGPPGLFRRRRAL